MGKRLEELDIKNKKIGFDPLLFTKAQIDHYQKASQAEFIAVDNNLVDSSRENIPAQSFSDIIPHDLFLQENIFSKDRADYR